MARCDLWLAGTDGEFLKGIAQDGLTAVSEDPVP